ncbi:uncharacterized protein LOC131876424 [Cryptomeria japonica]|uniref:uncharacterized protein LOC131876424 n=1 Tax=Cryptomeria japonica TaxID=3369 RepID=UPI0027D9D286|nr:uncharacterized protein LOC131876424 [Cryptomeria japonica]
MFILFLAIGTRMASTSSSIGNEQIIAKQRNDPNSPLWKYVDIIKQLSGGGGFRWKCHGCDIERNSSYYRVVGHLCGIKGRGIKKCPGKNGKPIPDETVMKYIREHEAAEEREARRLNQTASKKTKGMQGPSNPSIVVEDHPFFATNEPQSEPPLTRKRTKGPLETAFQNESRDNADQDIVRCIYANGLSFNVVRSPYWKQMIKSVNEAPRGYKGPSYEKVHGTLLEKEVKRVEDALKPIRDSWVETGVTIVSDGWKDAKNRPLINVIAVSPKGAMFLRAVDCEGQIKDGQFIAEILISAIESVGSRNVVQVIMDNAKNCRAAGLLVEQRYDHIFWTPCAVHSLNLMIRRIGQKIKWIRDVYAEAEDIQMFITNHHMSQGIFRTYSNLELLKVSEIVI